MNGEAFIKLAGKRRSTRLFQDRDLEDSKVKRVIQAALEAPTSCNRQLLKVVVIKDPEVKARACKLSEAQQSYFYDAPVILAVFYDISLENRNPCKTPYISTGMAIQNMLLMAEAMDLGAIYLGGIRNPKGMEKALGAPPFLQNLGVICLGYRQDTPPKPKHRSVEDIISVDKCAFQEANFLNDIRPEKWNFKQLADFREQLLWYKGIGIDARIKHVDCAPRYSVKNTFVYQTLGRMIQEVKKPAKLLDIMPFNGDSLLQLTMTVNEQIETLYSYEQTANINSYIERRLSDLIELDKVKFVSNTSENEMKIPVEDDSMDIVNCCERMNQFHDPRPLLKEIRRVLKKDGKALFLVSNKLYPHLYHYKRLKNKEFALGRNWNHGPECKLSHWDICKYFREFGFKITRSYGLNPIENKFYRLAARILRKLSFASLADLYEDKARHFNISETKFKSFSETLAYEITL
jgi:FMN reductase (NADPH)